MALAEIGKIMFQYKTALLPDIFVFEGIRFILMIPGMIVPFLVLSSELSLCMPSKILEFCVTDSIEDHVFTRNQLVTECQ